jgi:hypothetical protein
MTPQCTYRNLKYYAAQNGWAEPSEVDLYQNRGGCRRWIYSRNSLKTIAAFLLQVFAES